MSRFNRILELHKILSHRRTPISRHQLEEKLECSRSTIRRTIDDIKNYLNAPVKYDNKRNGYYYDKSENTHYELPGLWFNPSEIFALLTTHQMLAKVQPGLLEPHVTPLIDRLNKILDLRQTGSREITHRIRILQMAPRITDIEIFKKTADALVSRKKIKILYHGRERDKTTERWISPQRLIYYRDNWYLDAWCHLRKSLRSFSLDRIHIIYIGETAKDIADETLNAHFSDAYGIFAGKAKHNAVIRFTSQAARWVADEHWHSEQTTKLLPDGGWELAIPYSDPRELIMDIMKYGPDAEVIKPASLRKHVAEKTKLAAEKYNKN